MRRLRPPPKKRTIGDKIDVIDVVEKSRHQMNSLFGILDTFWNKSLVKKYSTREAAIAA